MQHLINDDVSAYVAESLDGFILANSDLAIAVPGGVTRAQPYDGKVAVVMGGGSGHFPAFAGWVGPGLAHGAACGEIFASPSTERILSVLKASDAGGGILMLPLNYAGDVLNFAEAARQLQENGVDIRSVVIADDIADPQPSTRRGIAGGFVVLKLVGAAADRGDSLDEVERIAKSAVASVRTLGVAFSGCTVPGADEPLFTVPEGRMAIGLGVHGEPGIDETDTGSTEAVADVLVDRLFAERAPEQGRRVGLLVNGLGTMEPDELHLLLRRIDQRVTEVGMTAVAPIVGEVMTSLDMAGISVTFSYLDDELEELWLAPARASAFARGDTTGGSGGRREVASTEVEEQPVTEGAEPSRRAADALVATLTAVLDTLHEHQVELGRLDAVAGDGDHGNGMARGVESALAGAQRVTAQGAGLKTTLDAAATEWSKEAGGTSGALWSAGLHAAAAQLSDDTAPDAAALDAAVAAFASAIAERGRASLGDKTMLDAIVPFAESFGASGDEVSARWSAAVVVATDAAAGTAAVPARIGRSRLHGDRSIGTPDPGATSFALIVETVGRHLA